MKFALSLRCLGLLAICLSFPVLTGCLAGGREEKTNHIFSGDTPVNGTVQVATNKPVPVISVDTAGKANYEERDCGQFVLMPPHFYRDVLARLKEREDAIKRYNELAPKYNELVKKYNDLIERPPAGEKGSPSGSEAADLQF